MKSKRIATEGLTNEQASRTCAVHNTTFALDPHERGGGQHAEGGQRNQDHDGLLQRGRQLGAAEKEM